MHLCSLKERIYMDFFMCYNVFYSTDFAHEIDFNTIYLYHSFAFANFISLSLLWGPSSSFFQFIQVNGNAKRTKWVCVYHNPSYLIAFTRDRGSLENEGDGDRWMRILIEDDKFDEISSFFVIYYISNKFRLLLNNIRNINYFSRQ